MRWTSILPAAALMGAIWAMAVPAAGAAAAAPDSAVLPGGCAPPHPLGLHASFPMDAPGGPPHGPGPLGALEPPLPPYLHGLSLSDAQEDKIFDLLHAQAPQVRQLARSLRKSRTQLRELGFSEKYDETAARGLIDAATRAEAELTLLRTRADHEILALLSPEQRSQALADVAAHERGGRDREGHEGHEGRGPAMSCWH